jgi:hypothetical protein
MSMDTNVKNLPKVSSKFKRCLFFFLRSLIIKTLFVNIHCRRGHYWSHPRITALVVLGSLVLAAVVTAVVVTLTLKHTTTATSTTEVTGVAIAVRRLAVYA